MITRTDLEKLGYSLKTKLVRNMGLDFKYSG